MFVARVRDGSFFPTLLEPRKRAERAPVAVGQEAYIQGVSTPQVDELVKSLGMTGISKSQVSRLYGNSIRRWSGSTLADWAIVLVGDSSFGVVELALVCQQATLVWVARMRMTAALYAPVPPQPKGKPGVKPKKGVRLPTPAQILANPDTRWGVIEVRDLANSPDYDDLALAALLEAACYAA